MDFTHTARPSPIAGTWYSGDPKTLQSEIDRFIYDAMITADEFSGKVIGIVVPHAGHIYSGKTAGYAYRVIKGMQCDVVVILSPFHQYHPGDLLTTNYDSYATPLGQIPVDTDMIETLDGDLAKEGIRIAQIQHDPEHSLEIQLPFLQRALEPGFTLLPLMMRTRDAKILKLVAQELLKVLEGKTYLIVASTDLSHFYSEHRAHQMDAEMLRRIKAMDADGVLTAEEEGTASACGASSVAMLLYAARQLSKAKAYILNYSTSADRTGDTNSVVGYGAAAVFI